MQAGSQTVGRAASGGVSAPESPQESDQRSTGFVLFLVLLFERVSFFLDHFRSFFRNQTMFPTLFLVEIGHPIFPFFSSLFLRLVLVFRFSGASGKCF